LHIYSFGFPFLRAKRFKRRAHFFSKELRLFPRRKVTALRDFMEVVQ
jgi:hypothetical protein